MHVPINVTMTSRLHEDTNLLQVTEYMQGWFQSRVVYLTILLLFYSVPIPAELLSE